MNYIMPVGASRVYLWGFLDDMLDIAVSPFRGIIDTPVEDEDEEEWDDEDISDYWDDFQKEEVYGAEQNGDNILGSRSY